MRNICRRFYLLFVSYTHFKKWKVHLIGHILRRNCRLKHITEVKVEEKIVVTEEGSMTYRYLAEIGTAVTVRVNWTLLSHCV
jgi:hypothetical protein